MILCAIVGDKDSKFSRIAPNVCYINNVGDSSAVVIDTCTFYNLPPPCYGTITRIELRGGSISKFGFDSQADRVRNGRTLSPTTIKIVGTRIDGSSGTHTRCVFDGGQGNSTLHIGDGSELIGQPMNLTAGMVVSREAIKNTSHVKRSSEGATTAVNARGVHSFYR
jgi:hypothetical protein